MSWGAKIHTQNNLTQMQNDLEIIIIIIIIIIEKKKVIIWNKIISMLLYIYIYIRSQP